MPSACTDVYLNCQLINEIYLSQQYVTANQCNHLHLHLNLTGLVSHFRPDQMQIRSENQEV